MRYLKHLYQAFLSHTTYQTIYRKPQTNHHETNSFSTVHSVGVVVGGVYSIVKSVQHHDLEPHRNPHFIILLSMHLYQVSFAFLLLICLPTPAHRSYLVLVPLTPTHCLTIGYRQIFKYVREPLLLSSIHSRMKRRNRTGKSFIRSEEPTRA